jgi:glycosyltransferase involved in cell wall biosynthesis
MFVWSTNVARSLEEQYGVAGENIHCVGAGSNVELHCDPVNRLYDGQTILFVGVEWERKGGPVLVDAFRRIKVTRPEARLIIVGCSPNVASDGIEIVGRQPLATLASYYERASIFCMPSRREPFGNAYIEAMTAGLPVVATSIGATSDFVRDGETGYLVLPDNVDELTAALLRLVGQPGHCQRLGSAGRRIAVDEYNWHAVARKIAAVIRSRLPRIDAALSTRG